MIEAIESALRIVPNFPKQGVDFIDISPVLEDPNLFSSTIEALALKSREFAFDKIVAIESRGFIFGSALALHLKCPFVMVRKPGKLPGETLSHSYELEYGSDTLEILSSSLKTGEKVLVLDDVLATGGSANAAAELVETSGAVVNGFLFFIELNFLNGRERLKSATQSLIHRT